MHFFKYIYIFVVKNTHTMKSLTFATHQIKHVRKKQRWIASLKYEEKKYKNVKPWWGGCVSLKITIGD